MVLSQRLEMYNAGATDKQIAKIEGTSAQSVLNWRKKHGLKSRHVGKNQTTICWDCQNYCGGCPWTRKPARPVPGWTATKTETCGGSYSVLDCPLFKRDAPRGIQLAEDKSESGEKKMVKKLFRDGWSDADIGRKLGLSDSSVAKIRHELGLVRKRKGVVVKVFGKDEKLICVGSFGECAEKLGVKERTLRAMYRTGVKKYRIEVVG